MVADKRGIAGKYMGNRNSERWERKWKLVI